MPLTRESLRPHLLTILTCLGAISGVILGIVLRSLQRESWWSAREVVYVGFIGDLYLRMLTMFVLPLLITAVVSGIATLDLQASWRIAVRAAIWLVAVEYVAVCIGILVAVIIRPGIGIAVENKGDFKHDSSLAVDTALDIFRNVFPNNFVEASMSQERTVLEKNESLPMEEWKFSTKTISGVNIPGLITFGITLGIAIGISLPGGKPLLQFCECIAKAMMIAIGWVLWCTPVAVCFMVAAKLISEKDLSGLLERLGLYFLTVLLALFLHGLVFLPAIYFAFLRKNPFKLLKHISQGLATSFGTASSNAALPVVMDCLESRAKLDGRLVRFLVPVATSINMDGTALYEAVAITFFSQLRGVHLDFAQLLLISITVTAACLGNAGVPQAGLVTMVLILGSLGLPPEDVTFIVAVDWLLDRFRTTVNVISDSIGCGIIEHLSQDELVHIGKRKYSMLPYADNYKEDIQLNDFTSNVEKDE